MIEINQDRVNDAIWIYNSFKDAAGFDYNCVLDAVHQVKNGNMIPLTKFALAFGLSAYIVRGIVGGPP